MSLSSYQIELLSTIFLGFHGEVEELPDEFLDELLVQLDKALGARLGEVESLVKQTYHAVVGRRKRADSIEKIWPSRALHSTTPVTLSTVIRCTKCERICKVEELEKQNGKRFPKTEEPGHFWQQVHYFCQCDAEHPFVSDYGDGDLLALLLARLEIVQ